MLPLYHCNGAAQHLTNNNMTTAQINKAFLNSLDSRIVKEIMSNISNHYGITTEEAYDELFDNEAESIMDYITGNIRQSVSLFYNKFLYKLA